MPTEKYEVILKDGKASIMKCNRRTGAWSIVKNHNNLINALSSSPARLIESRQQAIENFAREYLKKHRTRFINNTDISRSDKVAILHHFGYSAENVPR